MKGTFNLSSLCVGYLDPLTPRSNKQITSLYNFHTLSKHVNYENIETYWAEVIILI